MRTGVLDHSISFKSRDYILSKPKCFSIRDNEFSVIILYSEQEHPIRIQSGKILLSAWNILVEHVANVSYYFITTIKASNG